MTEDKLAAYQTLYTCLETVARLMAPVAPFYAEQLYSDLHPEAERAAHPQSVHLTDYPSADGTLIDVQLEKRMRMAQRITSLVLALRRKVAIKVRQPLARIMVPVLNEEFARNLKAVESVVLNELNVKSIEYLGADNTVIVKRVKPNFKVLGPRFGAQMKTLATVLEGLKQNEIVQFERQGELTVNLGDTKATVLLAEVEIVSDDIPGWEVASDGELTVALDVTLTDALREEGVAREVVNRVQNLRKESGLEVTDRIELFLATGNSETQAALKQQQEYISTQTLAVDAHFVDALPLQTPSVEVELDAPYSNLLIGLARVNMASTKNRKDR
ncbi:MAG: class I tRNA ligase family protein [Bacteroidia bacterium]|nr:class I tRNA ligase family protein [Bacteroidia bacterium]